MASAADKKIETKVQLPSLWLMFIPFMLMTNTTYIGLPLLIAATRVFLLGKNGQQRSSLSLLLVFFQQLILSKAQTTPTPAFYLSDQTSKINFESDLQISTSPAEWPIGEFLGEQHVVTAYSAPNLEDDADIKLRIFSLDGSMTREVIANLSPLQQSYPTLAGTHDSGDSFIEEEKTIFTCWNEHAPSTQSRDGKTIDQIVCSSYDINLIPSSNNALTIDVVDDSLKEDFLSYNNESFAELDNLVARPNIATLAGNNTQNNYFLLGYVKPSFDGISIRLDTISQQRSNSKLDVTSENILNTVSTPIIPKSFDKPPAPQSNIRIKDLLGGNYFVAWPGYNNNTVAIEHQLSDTWQSAVTHYSIYGRAIHIDNIGKVTLYGNSEIEVYRFETEGVSSPQQESLINFDILFLAGNQAVLAYSIERETNFAKSKIVFYDQELIPFSFDYKEPNVIQQGERTLLYSRQPRRSRQHPVDFSLVATSQSQFLTTFFNGVAHKESQNDNVGLILLEHKHHYKLDNNKLTKMQSTASQVLAFTSVYGSQLITNQKGIVVRLLTKRIPGHSRYETENTILARTMNLKVRLHNTVERRVFFEDRHYQVKGLSLSPALFQSNGLLNINITLTPKHSGELVFFEGGQCDSLGSTINDDRSTGFNLLPSFVNAITSSTNQNNQELLENLIPQTCQQLITWLTNQGEWVLINNVPTINRHLSGLTFLPASDYHQDTHIEVTISSPNEYNATRYRILLEGRPSNDLPTLINRQINIGVEDRVSLSETNIRIQDPDTKPENIIIAAYTVYCHFEHFNKNIEKFTYQQLLDGEIDFVRDHGTSNDPQCSLVITDNNFQTRSDPIQIQLSFEYRSTNTEILLTALTVIGGFMAIGGCFLNLLSLYKDELALERARQHRKQDVLLSGLNNLFTFFSANEDAQKMLQNSHEFQTIIAESKIDSSDLPKRSFKNTVAAALIPCKQQPGRPTKNIPWSLWNTQPAPPASQSTSDSSDDSSTSSRASLLAAENPY